MKYYVQKNIMPFIDNLSLFYPFSEPPPLPLPLAFPPPPHTLLATFFLSISPQRNTGEVQNKLMSESYSFLKDCKTTLHATYFFKKKTFMSNTRLRFDSN